ncbi:MAG: antitoxin family protein [Desulfurococcales archaeon]|nr:antitoxin family protein [Desulfurococcales archaeon]
MSKVIRARYEKGVFKPLEPLDLEDGVEVTLEVKDVSGRSGLRRFFGMVKTKESEPIREEEYYEHISERGHIPRQ